MDKNSKQEQEQKPSGSNFDCCEEALEALGPRELFPVHWRRSDTMVMSVGQIILVYFETDNIFVLHFSC